MIQYVIFSGTVLGLTGSRYLANESVGCSAGGGERLVTPWRDSSLTDIIARKTGMKAFTYILFSKSAGKFYTGSCDDVQKRFERHNSALVPSTKYGVPWKLQWYQQCESRSDARRLEQRIKKRGAKRFLNDQSKPT